MLALTEHAIINEMLDPVGECLTPEIAGRIAALRAAPKLQRRLNKLSEKNSDRKLTPGEDAEDSLC